MEDVARILPNTRAFTATLHRSLAALLALFDRRQVREVALDRGGEVVAVGAQQLRGPPCAGRARGALRASAPTRRVEPGPLGGDENGDRAGEQDDGEQAHELMIAPRGRAKFRFSQRR